ncbi:MAG: hypothetical protein HY646_11685 [Acidobacteria bacterium]|nr:hypothetical protein [Acidobacteriota bacterium]
MLNRAAYDFNRALYTLFPEVRVAPLDGLIQLERRKGEVCVARTLARLRDYVQERQKYLQRVRPYLHNCSLTIDVGVPFLARAAKEARITHLTVFDHSWACTLRGFCSSEAEYQHNAPPGREDRRLADQVAAEIERDEQCASRVFLFDRYITPPEFRKHWESLEFTPTILPGVLGGGQDPREARPTLNKMFLQLGQQAVAPKRKLVLLSPGGTPVWDELLPRMINGYLSRPAKEYLPVLSHPNVSKDCKAKMRKSDKIRWFEFVAGSTQQAVIPAFALVVTRAGGGIVNDCLATKTAFVCVQEHHWQVKLVERECKKLGIIPTLRKTSLLAFQKDPVGCIDAFVAAGKSPTKIGVPCGAEKDVAAFVLSQL